MAERINLSIRQIVLPALPLFLIIQLDMLCYVVADLHSEPRNMTWTTRNRHGEVINTRKTTQTVPVVHVNWHLCTVNVYQQKTITLNPAKINDWLPAQVQQTRAKLRTLALLAALCLSAAIMHFSGWHARITDASRVPPVRALLISCGAVILLAVGSWLIKSFWQTGVAEVSEAFSPAKSWSWMAAATFLIAPISEELVFRACLQRLLSRWMPPVAALVIQAFCFAMFHPTNLLHASAAFLGGLGFGIIYLATNRIWVPMGVHLFGNVVFVFLIL